MKTWWTGHPGPSLPAQSSQWTRCNSQSQSVWKTETHKSHGHKTHKRHGHTLSILQQLQGPNWTILVSLGVQSHYTVPHALFVEITNQFCFFLLYVKFKLQHKEFMKLYCSNELFVYYFNFLKVKIHFLQFFAPMTAFACPRVRLAKWFCLLHRWAWTF